MKRVEKCFESSEFFNGLIQWLLVIHEPDVQQARTVYCLHIICRLLAVQLIIFLVVELIHSDLNFRFNMSVIFTANYFLS
jgi:hypothetical protein